MQLNDILLHLSLIDGIGPGIIKKIVERMPANMQLADLYDMHSSDFITRFGVPEKIANLLSVGLADKRLFEQERMLLEKHAITLVTIADDTYPQLLKAINIPPAVLYYRGRLPDNDAMMLAVVGARQANYYGFGAIDTIIPDLVKKKITIISGGAIGIDRAAHEQTIRAGGKTVAVLGSGLLSLYPVGNRKLFESIVEAGGALISSFPLCMAAQPGHFPARNRIISGLSRGCLVVQAAKKSGALITARYALEQGREVFAVPGPIDSFLSAGCHALIREGATLVTSAQDIEQVFEMPICSSKSEQVKTYQIQESILPDTLEEQIKMFCSKPQSIDDLVHLTGLSFEALHEQLFSLQLKGQLQQDFMGLWQRI